MALVPTRENGPAARSFAADAHDCIMVRIQTEPAVYKFGGARLRPNGELPSDPQQTRYRQTPKLCKKPLSQFIIPPRAQASKPAPGLNRGRCETQAPLSGKPPSFAKRFGPLTPSARSANLIAGDGRRTAFPLRTKNRQQTKTPLDRKSPIQVRIHLPPAESPLRTCLPGRNPLSSLSLRRCAPASSERRSAS